jgi:hypothetical protein
LVPVLTVVINGIIVVVVRFLSHGPIVRERL